MRVVVGLCCCLAVWLYACSINKSLLLKADDFIFVLIDSLLLDDDHPRRAQPDFDKFAPAVQCDFAEAIAQLAMYPPGRQALLLAEEEEGNTPGMGAIEALRQVASEGWTQEAKLFAESALAALADRQPSSSKGTGMGTGTAAHMKKQAQQQKHVMLSCEYTHDRGLLTYW